MVRCDLLTQFGTDNIFLMNPIHHRPRDERITILTNVIRGIKTGRFTLSEWEDMVALESDILEVMGSLMAPGARMHALSEGPDWAHWVVTLITGAGS